MDICVLLVSYNRKQALQQALAAYEAQRYAPKAILVVDNASTDGTREMLEKWQEEQGSILHAVLLLPENKGGSGGFAAGTEQALSLSCDWIFFSDDDAMPQPDTLERLARFAEAHPALMPRTAALCGAVKHGERYVVGHRARKRRFSLSGILDRPVSERCYREEFFTVDFYSYIGTCIKASALQEAGACRADFFIYSDDFEHAWRVGRVGDIYCVPGAVMHHADNNPYEKSASWRDYYATRNLLIMYRTHFGALAFWRRALLRCLTAISSCNPQKMRVIGTAIRDAGNGKTGLHSIYRPGWQPDARR